MEPSTLDYCPGATKPDGTRCRTDADCDPEMFEVCGPPGAAGPCGGAGGCIEPWTMGTACQSNDECADIDGVPGACYTGTDPCCGEVSVCVPRCTDTSCGEGMRCGSNVTCEAIPCADGYDCPEGSRCEGGAPTGDAHGCVIIPCDEPGALACPELFDCEDKTCQRSMCERDSDCSCGNCLGGQCWNTPWFCYAEPV